MNDARPIPGLDAMSKQLWAAYKRFPLAFVLIFVFTALMYTESHSWIWLYTQNNVRILLSIVPVFFLSIALTLYAEQMQYSSMKKYIFLSLSIIFWVLFFQGINIDINIFYYSHIVYILLTSFWIIASLFISPFLTSFRSFIDSQEQYYWYFFQVSKIFTLSAFVWMIVWVLWLIAIVAIDFLFDVYSYSLYWDWTIFTFAFFTPLYGLTKFPKLWYDSPFETQKFFTFLIKYIAVPSIFFYFIILYLYTIQILFIFLEWPRWELSWLVIWFSSFGYLVYIFSYIYEHDTRIVEIFRRYFPYAVLFQAGMLFYAIYLRIAQYDLTINRYFVVVFWVWLLVISLYYIFSRKKLLIATPALLTIIILIISIGPWSVYQLPETRQIQRLEHHLEMAGILRDGEIYIPTSPSEIEPALSHEIYDGIRYLCNWQQCRGLGQVFPDQYNRFFNEHKNSWFPEKWPYRDPWSWEIQNAFIDMLRVERYWTYRWDSISEIEYRVPYSESFYPMHVLWYDVVVEIQDRLTDDTISASFDSKSSHIDIFTWMELKERFSLETFIDDLYEKHGWDRWQNIPRSDMITSLPWEHYDITLLMRRVVIKKPLDYNVDWDEIFPVSQLNGYALIRKK